MMNEKRLELVENKIYDLLVTAEVPLAAPICWLINPDEGLIFVRTDEWERMLFNLKPKRHWAMITIRRNEDGILYLPDLMNATIENYDSVILPASKTKKEAARKFSELVLNIYEFINGVLVRKEHMSNESI